MTQLDHPDFQSASKPGAKRSSLPRGLWLLIVIDFWERFSYYGMLAILVLFLSAPSAEGGLGWSQSSALFFFGIYGASGFALPLVGGLIADRWIGARRAVAIGAAVMAAGHILLGLAAFSMSYTIIFGALALIMAGNGLFKTPLITLIGSLFPDGSGRQEGYGLYYSAINAGAFVSGIVVGWLAEVYGWHAGFTAAGAGMIVAWLLFVIFAARALPANMAPDRPATTSSAWNLDAQERRALLKLVTAAILATVFAAGWFQFEGFWYLAFDGQVDRNIGGFTIPTAWALSFQTLLVVVGAPIVGRLMAEGRFGSLMSPAYLFATGFLFCAAAQLVGMLGLSLTEEGASTPLSWWVAVYGLTALGEIILWPSTYAMVYRYAPERLRSTILGFWLLTIAAGKFAAGSIGSAASEYGPLMIYPWLIAVLLAGAFISILALPKKLEE